MVVVVRVERMEVAIHSGKGHCGDQDEVGDGEYQHKDETDDAKLFSLL